jgi:crotonobetainyl-CoA:carnitine CoA-transferase CaiB-like acyl-CoA transferase
MLADMGAEVIKIEPLWGGRLRFSPPLIKGESPGFAVLNRNKKGMAIDLKKEEGVEIVKQLVKHADVVFENFSLGTLDRLGIGYDVLKEINPGIIYVTITGFGYTGPYAHRRSFDIIAQAMSGLMTLTGEEAQVDYPVHVADYLGDMIPALTASNGILGALYYKKVTGKGQRVDVAQLDSMIYILGSIFSYLSSDMTAYQSRKKFRIIGSYDAFPAKDGWVVIAAPMGAIVDRLSKAMNVEKPDIPAIREWVKDQAVNDVVTTLVEAGVPVAPVYSVDQVVTDPHVRAREMILEVDHPTIGKIKVPGFPIKYSETPFELHSSSPLLGQHNEEILSTLLSYSKDRIAKLKEEKVIL